MDLHTLEIIKTAAYIKVSMSERRVAWLGLLTMDAG
jgi:hypothetical protein